jgi:uncharacterized protein YraI
MKYAMRATSRLLLSLTASFSLAASAASPAIVISDQVNARARPGVAGEVLTHLKRGELVHVLDEVTDPQAKGSEPKRWAKIEMPAFVPVWVSADLVDTSTMTVKGDGVNLRAGPGKNFSSVGVAPRGTQLTQISSEGGWVQVEAPAGAYAFVSTKLLSSDAPPDRLVAKPASPARTDPKWISAPEPAAPGPTGPVLLPVPADPAPVELDSPAATATKPLDEPTVARELDPAPAAAVAPILAATATTPPSAPKGDSAGTETRRVVTRLGVIKRSWNVKSPSFYSLRSLNKGEGELDLLWSPDPKLDLSAFLGRKALIKGEEYIDSDWPRTPLLKIESITTY